MADEVAWAEELLAAAEENRKLGKFAFNFHGQMVDVPHFKSARTILAWAKAAASA